MTPIRTNTPQLVGKLVQRSSARPLDGESAKSEPSHSSSERCQGEIAAKVGRNGGTIKSSIILGLVAADAYGALFCRWHRLCARPTDRRRPCCHWPVAVRRRDC